MSLVLTRGPAVEPVSLAEVKAHLKIDGSAEDILLQSLIQTSRLHIESALWLALISQSWSLLLDVWPPDGWVRLPIRPVAGVTAIRINDGSGGFSTLSGDAFECDIHSVPPRLKLSASIAKIQPGAGINGISIDLEAGFGEVAADVPAPIRQALLLLVAHWYEHRDPIEIGSLDARIPPAVSALLASFAEKRL